MTALVGMEHRGEFEVALTDVFIRGGHRKHQDTIGIQILPLHVRNIDSTHECVLAGKSLYVLDGSHVDDALIRHTARLLRVHHWLEILVDRGEELLQLLVLADGLQTTQTLLGRLVVIRHRLSRF